MLPPLLLCLQTSKCPTLLKQLWSHCLFQLPGLDQIVHLFPDVVGEPVVVLRNLGHDGHQLVHRRSRFRLEVNGKKVPDYFI